MKRLVLFLFLTGCASTAVKPVETSNYLKNVQAVTFRAAKPSTCPTGELKENNWEKLLSLAARCVQAKNYDQTEKIANRLATQDPTAPWGTYYLSVVSEMKGDLNRAAWMIELSSKKANQSAVVLYQMGRIAFLMGDTRGSVETFRRVLKLDPDMLEANLALGHILYREQYHSEALAYFEKALKKDNQNFSALLAASQCLIEKNDYKQAVVYLTAAQDLEPNKAQIRLKRAQILEENLKDLPEALASYKQIKSSRRLDEKLDVEQKIKKLEAQVAVLEKAARAPAGVKGAK